METGQHDTSAAILDAAQRRAQVVGYSGLSFRDLAADIGIKSASVHYHFPTKGQLGAALARRYTDRFADRLDAIGADDGDAVAALQAYIGIFRGTVEQDGKMCLGGILSAERDSVPPEVRAEVRRFIDLNVRWIAGILERSTDGTDIARAHAEAIFAALEGAMLMARGMEDIATFDRITAQFWRTGFLPGRP